MKKICKIKKLLLFIISISVIPSVFSYITQFSEEELKTYNKLLNKSVGLNIEIAKYEIRMEKIQFNFKLKIKFKHIKEKNNELYEKVKILKKDVLIIVGIIVHKRAPKYHTLHEEVSIKQEIDKLRIEKIDNPNKEGESEERKINQNSMDKVEKEKEIKT